MSENEAVDLSKQTENEAVDLSKEYENKAPDSSKDDEAVDSSKDNEAVDLSKEHAAVDLSTVKENKAADLRSKEYEDKFDYKYGSDDEYFAEALKKTISPPPCIYPWYNKPRRNFDYSRSDRRDDNRDRKYESRGDRRDNYRHQPYNRHHNKRDDHKHSHSHSKMKSVN